MGSHLVATALILSEFLRVPRSLWVEREGKVGLFEVKVLGSAKNVDAMDKKAALNRR